MRSHQIYFSVCVQTSSTKQSAFEIRLLSDDSVVQGLSFLSNTSLSRDTTISLVSFPGGEYWGCFHPGGCSTKSCREHLHSKLFRDIYFPFSGINTWKRIAGPWGQCVFNFLRSCQAVSQSDRAGLPSHQQRGRVPAPPTLPHIQHSCSFNYSHSGGRVAASHCDFNWHSLLRTFSCAY